MTEKKPSLQTDIRKLFDEHEVLTIKKLYELLGANNRLLQHRVRATVHALKEKKEHVRVEKGKWKKA